MTFKTIVVRKNVKKQSIKSAKKKAWDTFSKWVRLSNADSDGYVQCYTCPTRKHWKEMQAGHFIDGRGNVVLFHEGIVKPQCMPCNIFKKGNKDVFAPKMIMEYGGKKVMEFYALKNQVVQLRIADYNEITEIYKEKIADKMVS